MAINELRLEIITLQTKLNNIIKNQNGHLTDEKLVNISKKLDNLIVEYLKLTEKTNKEAKNH
ncbi:MAG: aspartyl-phosphate phosphatase Spo0E family protein [Xylanivirga thermophila]|jgi:hypothetical protein|uniref:aspartyl-phosphate phosphatase Spo0E family protein n=1 Tax=Xylanivirga thermophila TaxID=2496273 RepID=UPI00101D660A|nr:aspartyl-phosphate phosphatase Spo0E family protein [Xylanivirga thermophila]